GGRWARGLRRRGTHDRAGEPLGEGAGRRRARRRRRAHRARPRLLEGGGGQDRGGGRPHRGVAGVIEILQNLQNVTKIPELKRRLLVTAGLLAAYRLRAHLPPPRGGAAAPPPVFSTAPGTLRWVGGPFSGGRPL